MSDSQEQLLTLQEAELATGISRFTWYKMLQIRGQVKGAGRVKGKLVIPISEVARIVAAGQPPTRGRGRRRKVAAS